MAGMNNHRDGSRNSMLDSLNVFDDEFAVDDFAIADGFRPRRTSSASSRRSMERVPTSISAHYAPSPVTPSSSSPMNLSRQWRKSIRKSRGMMENPFTSVEDDEAESSSSINRAPSHNSQSTISHNNSVSGRSISSAASSNAFARTHSPYLGESGPSHPYQMYPQNTAVGRTLSTSTATAIRPAMRVSTSSQGPTHPYGMYTQNVDESMDDDSHQEQGRNDIPVGFPGMQPPQFHRRLTDDDGLSIGAHSEQLPPYSEYPEDGAPKNVFLPPQPGQTVSPAQQSAIPLVQRAPQSMSDNRGQDANRRQSSAQEAGGVASSIQSNKTWSEKSWKEKRKTKFCGISFGWILLTFGVVVFIVIVLSAAIGGFVHSQHEAALQAASLSASAQAEQLGTTPTNSLYDATPLATPAAPLPTGSFMMQLGAPQEVQSQCLTNSSQAPAWSCNVLGESPIAINITNQGPGQPQMAAIYQSSDNDYIDFGTEPPVTQISPLQLVTDMDDPGRGPAYQFQAIYNKVVVVDQSAFQPATVGSASGKRDATNRHRNQHWTDRSRVAAGQQPWFCYWNNTLVEGFIYLQENATSWFNQSGNHNGGSSGSSSWSSATSSNCAPTGTNSPPPPTATSTATDSSQPSSCPDPDSNTAQWQQWSSMPLYPLVIKIEERRVPGSPPPYCQKMQILDNGQAGPLPYTVQISENDPTRSAYSSAGLKSRSIVQGACHCQWLSGGS